MKKIMVIVMLLLFHYSGYSQTRHQDTLKQAVPVMMQKTQENGGSKLASSEIEILNKRIEVLERNETFIYSALAIFFTLLAILLGFFQWFSSVSAEERVFSKLAKIANQDKKAFKSSLKQKSVEFDLMNSYAIRIMVGKENDDSKELENILTAYHFGNVEVQLFSDFDSSAKTSDMEKTVFIYMEGNTNNVHLYGFIEKNRYSGHLYMGKGGFTFPENVKCFGYSSSFSKLYENLMSLLHYKRYLNKSRG